MAGDFPDQIEVLRSEHRQVEAVLAEAAGGAPADPAWPARLTDVLGVLRQHIFKDQDGVFPAALATLTSADWETIEKVRAEAGSGLAQP
jgi:Hemerythrin HHE cation binding domain